MATAWENYKKKLGDSRPWDLIDKQNYASEFIQKTRYDICLKCPELINITKQCKQCGCFMNLKTKLQDATCPIDKW